MLCHVEGCRKSARGRYCSMHAARVARHGTPFAKKNLAYVSDAERWYAFWKSVDKSGPCWIWTGHRNNRGYGTLGKNYAHRYSYEKCCGPIPRGLCVLHRCDNPPCVRPDHLFLGTRKDNALDMSAKRRGSGQRKTHCINGHLLSGANLKPAPNNVRFCRECAKARNRELRKRKN
jgi:hypothetical protein